MLRTKPNPMSIFTSVLFLLLSIAGIIYAIFAKEAAVIVLAVILILLFFVLGVALAIGTFANYEEIKDDTLVVHRYFKEKVIKLTDISFILFYGAYVTLANELEVELCTISTNKANLLPILEYIEKEGAVLKDLRESDSNSDEV